MHPVDVCKVRLQLLGSADSAVVASTTNTVRGNVFSVGAHLVRVEGGSALFAGLTASLMRQVTFIGTKFGAYELISNKAKAANGGQINFVTKTACGLSAGAIGGVVGNPFDLAMVRMQADGRLPKNLQRSYTNGITALTSVVREEGVLTLWRGCAPTIIRAMIVTASQLAVYDQAKEVISANSAMTGPKLHLAASSFAGVVASLTSNPIDLVKSRLMYMKADPATGILPYRGTFHCLYRTAQTEGPLALYKGLDATIARQVPLNIVRFLCMEQLRQLFAKY